MPLYTHLQQAQVGLFSHYLIAQADALFRDFDRLYSAFTHVNQSPLGAGPVGGTSIAIDRHSTAKMLGFDSVLENSLDATSTRDFVAEYVSMIAIMMTNLSRISEDFIIWSTSEFSFIELADEFTSPSSVMPQKKNPDILELIQDKGLQKKFYQENKIPILEKSEQSKVVKEAKKHKNVGESQKEMLKKNLDKIEQIEKEINETRVTYKEI